MAILEARDVSKRYDVRGIETWALRGVSLAIEDSEGFISLSKRQADTGIADQPDKFDDMFGLGREDIFGDFEVEPRRRQQAIEFSGHSERGLHSCRSLLIQLMRVFLSAHG